MRARTATATVLLALATLTACGGDNTDDAKAPVYKVTEQETSGNTRQIEASVDSTTDLEAVFRAITADLTDEAAYYVSINCTTGGTATTDNRLANGRLARGTMGEAATGLKDGETEFTTVKGHTCP